MLQKCNGLLQTAAVEYATTSHNEPFRPCCDMQWTVLLLNLDIFPTFVATSCPTVFLQQIATSLNGPLDGI